MCDSSSPHGRVRKARLHSRLVVVCLVAAGLTACGLPRLGEGEAALVLEDLAAGRGGSRLKERTAAPARSAIRFTIEDRAYDADMYRSAAGTRAGIVLVPGIAPRGKDDPRLVAVANTLARVGFAVLVPASPREDPYQVRAEDVQATADAFRYLINETVLPPGGRAGMAGFSYGAGPVILAALREPIRERVDFIVSVGGYYDMREAITFFTTGYHRAPPREGEASRWMQRTPNDYARWIFARSNVELLEHPADRRAIEALATEMMGTEIDQPLAPPAFMTAGGQALYSLLINDDPERATALMAQLPEEVRMQIHALNPAEHDLSRIAAHAILLHGRSDNLIPYTQSLALARALPPDRVQLILIEGLAHVDLRPRSEDVPQLIQAVQALLDQRAPS